jgi:hypothetical protein
MTDLNPVAVLKTPVLADFSGHVQNSRAKKVCVFDLDS